MPQCFETHMYQNKQVFLCKVNVYAFYLASKIAQRKFWPIIPSPSIALSGMRGGHIELCWSTHVICDF